MAKATKTGKGDAGAKVAAGKAGKATKVVKAGKAATVAKSGKPGRAATASAPPPAPIPDVDDGFDVGKPSRSERRSIGKGRRRAVPVASLGTWPGPVERPDPIEILEATNTTRVQELVPIRYGRMMASPFTYYRGSPAVMASDLSSLPRTGFGVQASGDAHLLNFGLFASPERQLVFDLNDFDETLPGPWEWDVHRLATSLVIAGRELQLDTATCDDLATVVARSYAHHLAAYAEMGNLEVWYSRVDSSELERVSEVTGTGLDDDIRRSVDENVQRAQRHTSVEALPKLTQVVDGRRRIIDDPPLITHVQSDHTEDLLDRAFRAYRRSLEPERRVLLDRYTIVDFAMKVVGVGSVGTRCFVLLLVGEDGHDPLFLQVKEAADSVLAPFVGHGHIRHQGERVVVGQRLMQAASDIFLGWTTGPQGHQFYLRQLRDMKGSARVERMDRTRLSAYGAVCAWTLARAHARTGDASTITGYIGKGNEFAAAITRFARAYADQNEQDHERFVQAVNDGRLFATPGY